MHSAGTMEKASTVNWSMAEMKSVKTSGQSTREKLRRVERPT